jgi:hypothetical protein
VCELLNRLGFIIAPVAAQSLETGAREKNRSWYNKTYIVTKGVHDKIQQNVSENKQSLLCKTG